MMYTFLLQVCYEYFNVITNLFSKTVVIMSFLILMYLQFA